MSPEKKVGAIILEQIHNIIRTEIEYLLNNKIDNPLNNYLEDYVTKKQLYKIVAEEISNNEIDTNQITKFKQEVSKIVEDCLEDTATVEDLAYHQAEEAFPYLVKDPELQDLMLKELYNRLWVKFSNWQRQLDKQIVSLLRIMFTTVHKL